MLFLSEVVSSCCVSWMVYLLYHRDVWLLMGNLTFHMILIAQLFLHPLEGFYFWLIHVEIETCQLSGCPGCRGFYRKSAFILMSILMIGIS